jgi:hypothetical protein
VSSRWALSHRRIASALVREWDFAARDIAHQCSGIRRTWERPKEKPRCCRATRPEKANPALIYFVMLIFCAFM